MEGTQQGDLSPPIAPQLLLEGCSLLSIISIFLRVLCLALYRHSTGTLPALDAASTSDSEPDDDDDGGGAYRNMASTKWMATEAKR